MWRRSSIRLRRLARRVLGRDPSPERTARGIAAGFFAAAFPLPGLQIPLSIFVAWLVGGNKAVAILPQFISNAGTMPLLVFLQYWLGAKLWPGQAVAIGPAMHSVGQAIGRWTWLAPADSFVLVVSSLADLGADILGPLTIGILLTGAALAVAAYPISLIALTYAQILRLRRRVARGLPLHPKRPLRLPKAAPSEPDIAVRYAVHNWPLIRAAGVKLLVDGCQAYPEMLGCIARAQRSVALETYILCADQTGRRFAAALREAAARKLEVRLLFDGIGALGLPYEFVASLMRAGVKVAVYRPIWKFWRSGLGPLNRRDHRKILVVDGCIGFTGGLNIGDDYQSKDDGGGGWRDTHLRLDGAEAVGQMARLFEETWASADEYRLPVPLATVDGAPAAASAPPCETVYTSCDVPVQVLGNKEFLQRVRLRRAYLHAIRNAKRYILIENAYFIPDRGIRRALYRAVRRGVVVAVAVAMYSDVRVAAMASRALYPELLSGGVRLYEYPLSMLHSKAAVIDDIWSIVSSYNLDHRSLLHNLEAAVLVFDHRFSVALRDRILADIHQCREVNRALHEARPWNEALLEALAYQLRYWL